jgi:ATP synthase subunit 6
MSLFIQFKNPQYFNSKIVTDEFRVLIFNNFLIKKQIFISLFYTIFFFLVCSNVFGLIPYSVTTTSFFITSFFFSAVAFLSCVFVGFYKNQLKFFSKFLPSGVPYEMGLLLVLIEVISYNSRLLSLSIRLFANMMSGHTLIKILLGFS